MLAQVIPLNPLNDDEGNALSSWEKSQDWQLYQDIDGGFEVLIPAEWAHSVDTVTTEVGDLLYHTYYLNTPAVDTVDNVFYMLSYVEYPEGSLHEDSLELVEELLDASEEEAVTRMKGELRFSTKKEIDFHPGRYWRIDYLDGEASMRTQAFVSENRYYAIQTISRIRSGINDSTQKFFGSLNVY
ncbi:hypothetical protein CEQ90_11695 [Lewinellaceae bacterium SD302]|nr:hypothetical protein CEQ90_11695 [Lewinellaceae bacterium SD302]